jgi:hypothetical protein
MPSISDEIAYLRGAAAHMRRLSAEHAEAGNSDIAGKLAEVADELEQKADRLEQATKH